MPHAWGEPFFAYFFLAFEKKVSRRKGETLSGRYRSNGYVHLQKRVGCQTVIAGKPAPTVDRIHPHKPGQPIGRHREQAHAYKKRKQPKGQCAVTLCRKPEPLGDSANANCVRLCICVNRNTCDTYNFTVFSVIPNSHAI